MSVTVFILLLLEFKALMLQVHYLPQAESLLVSGQIGIIFTKCQNVIFSIGER